MKFLALKIYIGILEIVGFLLITSSLIAMGWALLGGEHPLRGQSMVQAAIVIAVVSGILFIGLVVVACAQLLEVLICIENNTACTAENTAQILENATRAGEAQPRAGEPTQLIERLFSGKAWRLTVASLVLCQHCGSSGTRPRTSPTGLSTA